MAEIEGKIQQIATSDFCLKYNYNRRSEARAHVILLDFNSEFCNTCLHDISSPSISLTLRDQNISHLIYPSYLDSKYPHFLNITTLSRYQRPVLP